MNSRDDALQAIEASLDRPSAARVYDYFIGGNTHYAVDREFAEKVRNRLPLIGDYCRTSRQFLGRAVRRCVREGIRQFVDLGSGLPTTGNVHEVADDERPDHDVRVLYLDNEAVALAHSEILLADTADPDRHQALAADLLRPGDLWERVLDSDVIDAGQPIALIVNAVLHFIQDDQDPDGMLATYREQLAPGSLLVLSQMTNENPVDDEERQALADLVEYYKSTTNPAVLRTVTEFERFFGGWPMLEPGLGYAPAFHPDAATVFADSPSESRVIGGIARKPR
ncbi:SAM-dependent methyltransferase [Amycolatopsis jiangsuensis]|uniref:O-methyltransferase involved in polyketide biosynthesis n=1 Tax=Amycolatopsis jiangsuensis TaxID=1181879 RepID=A0A840IYU3_9PSEU|nr:SAM-dependent methyltransferase [Amycolatopsis jiangsuensis]MBB4686863.1 O-methyltransferase involved in polyketide biosynthesis [Amycolatopsis jiangsuensis]